MTPLPSLRSLPHARFLAVLEEAGGRRFQAEDAKAFLWKHGAAALDGITTLPQAVRARLAAAWSVDLPATVRRQIAPDGTVKVLLEWPGGGAGADAIAPASAEAVLMPGVKGRTVCLSVQAGCRLRCAFCATGTLGLARNLAFGEILDQVLVLSGEGSIARVVVMGMGEPLENLDELVPALDFLTAPRGLGWSRTRITVSTVGLVPELDRLARSGLGVELAISLHATTDTIRTALVPVNRKYPIEAVLAAARRYQEIANAKVTLEYILLEDINDADEDIERLAAIGRRGPFGINLIRYNAVPGIEFAPSPRLDEFAKRLTEAGARATVRRSRGQAIDAACGQLAGRGRTG